MTIERFDPPAAGRQLALVNPTTDSWTAVLADVIDLARGINGTEFVPVGLRGSVEKVTAAVLHGRELGLPPMTALAHTSVINGRTGISAEVMRALILQAGHDLQIDVSDSRRCTIRGQRKDWASDRWTAATWTIEDAAKAGLLEDKRTSQGKVIPSMYKVWPAAMLLARATTTLARMVFADVIHGMRSVEELQEMIEPGERAESTPASPMTTQVSRQSAAGAVPADEPATVAGAPVEADPEQPRPASTAGRKRPAPTRRGVQPTPPAAPAEDVKEAAQPSLDQPETAEAEVVSDEGDPDATPANPDNVTDVKAALRKRTMATVQMQYERLLGKPVDRAERLLITGVIVRRPVESTNELTAAELGQVLAKLERTRDREALVAILNTAGGE